MNTEDRKSVASALFLSTLIILLGTVFYATANDGMPGLRKFRPMKMAKVKVSNPSVKVEACSITAAPVSIAPLIEQKKSTVTHVSEDGSKAREMGWLDFEVQNWSSARDWFITALEADPSNVDSAKGLVMSIYYSGATGDAYQLGRELGVAMPELRGVVPDAVADEVRLMLKSSKADDAEKLLKQFPSTDPRFVAIAEEVKKAAKAGSAAVASATTSSTSEVKSVVEFTRNSRASD